MNANEERIAIFMPSLRGGGAEKVMLNLARGFLEQGMKIDLVVAQAEGPYLQDLPAEIRVVDLGARRVRHSVPGLARYLRNTRPTGLLSAMGHANMAAVLARLLAGVPTRVVATLHNTMAPQISGTSSLKSRFMLWIAGRCHSMADAVVAVSGGVAEDAAELMKLPRKKIQVIYNPVVNEQLFQRAAEPLIHDWFRPGSPPVVLSVGRLTEQKDYGVLVHAISRVRESMAVRLLILGEGEQRQELQDLVNELGMSEEVLLPGFVPNPYQYMRLAKLFVLSSRWEGLPTVLIEALALGIPIVSTDCPSGPVEILKGGRLGRLVPVGDVEALAAAIGKALSAPEATGEDPDLQRFTTASALQAYRRLLQGAQG